MRFPSWRETPAKPEARVQQTIYKIDRSQPWCTPKSRCTELKLSFDQGSKE